MSHLRGDEGRVYGDGLDAAHVARDRVLVLLLHPNVLQKEVSRHALVVKSDELEEELAAGVVKVQLFAGEGEPLTGGSAYEQVYLRKVGAFHLGDIAYMLDVGPVGLGDLYGVLVDLRGEIVRNGYPGALERKAPAGHSIE